MMAGVNAFVAVLIVAAVAAPCAQASRYEAVSSPQCQTIDNGGWKQLIRSGEGNNLGLGALIDRKGVPMSYYTNLGLPYSNNPDFTSLLPVRGELYAVTQFESPAPSPINLLRLNQNKATGELTVQDVIAIDLSKYGGAWITCAGSVSPWNTHLGAEEYEPDARAFGEATCLRTTECGDGALQRRDLGSYSSIMSFLPYLGLDPDTATLADVRARFNPYLYGHTIEVKAKGSNKYEAKKWFTTGRVAQELSYVMPDGRTVYTTDDGDRVGFYKLVLDRAHDLSSGTLYAAKATQTSPDGAANGGAFNIDWIMLGRARQDDLEDMLEDGLKFTDVFETETPTGTGATTACPTPGFVLINQGTWPAAPGTGEAAGPECLRLKAGKSVRAAAAFFETRRLAAVLGATTEFTKWEGFTFSPKRMTAYTAMSDIRNTMTKAHANEPGGPDHVRVATNRCGCVYSMTVDASYSITSMAGFICGTDNGSGAAPNRCSVDGIASPDNISVMDDQDVLIIGEDTSNHQNDVVWAYSFVDGSMVRVFSTPYGAETTSPYFYKNINGWAYMVAVVQHPYGESDQAKASEPEATGTAGYLGYFAFKASDIERATVKFTGFGVATTNLEKHSVLSSSSMEVCRVGRTRNYRED